MAGRESGGVRNVEKNRSRFLQLRGRLLEPEVKFVILRVNK